MKKRKIVFDFETFFDPKQGYTLKLLSPPEYILDSRFETISLAVYDLDWPAPKLLLPHEIKPFLAQLVAEDVVAIAHNMLFDGAILAWRYDFVPGLLQDTLGMARALRDYKRNSLGAVAEQLFGYNSKGDTVHKVAGMHVQDIKNAGLWPEHCTYAMNDAGLCGRIYKHLLPEFTEPEQRIMDLVLRAGIVPTLHTNISLLQNHLDGLRKNKERLLRECNYDKAALMSTAQFKTALEDLGVDVATKANAKGKPIPAFAKTDPFMTELCEYNEADDDTNYRVQTLAMARLSQRSTIEETRCQRFLNIAKLPWRGTGTRVPLLPVPLRYGGAHTHRLSGEWGMNLQNLPRDKTKSKLRQSIVAPEGFKLITADEAQIEARLVARCCRQEDLLAQFRRGEDVYANFGTKLFRKPVSKTTTPDLRFISKTAILGLGYGCGADRFYRMVTTQARQYGIKLDGLFDERVAKYTVDMYRNSFPNIKNMWWVLDQHINNIIRNPKLEQFAQFGPTQIRSGQVTLPGASCTIDGPGGRHNVGLFLQYKSDTLQQLYGCKLLENIIQALARWIVMEAALRLADRGLRFSLQAHDELVFCVPNEQVESAKVIIQEEMTKEPAWLDGLPLAVEVGVGDNYSETK